MIDPGLNTQRPWLAGFGLLAALTLTFQFASCGSTGIEHEENRAMTQRDAGSVHLAVLSVAPWSHYVKSLAPKFSLTADQALGEVIQDSRRSATAERSRTGISAQFEEGDEVQDKDDSYTYESSSQSVPRGEGSSVDSLLRYQSATALYQEVQLLSRAIEDAALKKGCRPYLVRVQLTLMPRRRHEPYDAYATLSFFTPPQAEKDNGGVLGDGVARAEGASPTYSLRDLDLAAAGSGARGPSILPLLVTDNLEATLQSRLSQSSNTISLGVLGSYLGSFASDISAELYQSAVQADLQARDLNSLLTVARLSDNSLRVRIGATQEATADYAMTPRNHNITLLVMVPEESDPSIDLIGRVTFVDAQTGEELPPTSDALIDSLLRKVANDNGFGELTNEDLRTLASLAQVNDQIGFFGALNAESKNGLLSAAPSYSFWVELVSVFAGGQYFSSSFDLPGHEEQIALSTDFFEQTALAIDDGSTKTVVELHGATLKDGVDVSALIVFYLDGQEIRLPARAVAYEGDGNYLRFTFPSLKALGFAAAATEGLGLFLNLPDQNIDLQALYVSSSE